MLQALLTFLEDPQLDEPFVRLESLAFSGSDAVLVVRVMNYGGTETWKRWRIDVAGLRDHEVRDPHGDLHLDVCDHVLARQHTDTQQILTFAGAPPSVPATIGELVVAHRDVTDGWITFDRYFNAQCKLDELLAGGHGELAAGPSFLVAAYAEVLKRAGVQPSLLAKRQPTWWDGGRWNDMEPTLATLRLGDAYFVAAHFKDFELPPDGG
jgi:hypothetical protein